MVYDLVMDIETVGSELTEEEWSYLLKRESELAEEEREKYREKVRRQVAMWGLTGHVVSVALGVIARRGDGASLAKVKVMYLNGKDEEKSERLIVGNEEHDVNFVSYGVSDGIESAERRMIEQIWHILSKVQGRLITYNGRRFDLPFLMLRSLVLNVPISRYHLKNRFDYNSHLDVMDVLAFHGIGRFSSLDFVCRRLGIPTPKGILDGSRVEEYFYDGRYEEIATYNFYDVWATTALYDRILKIFGPMLGDGYR